ncbi:MAG: hypothetical protein J6K72_08370 [Clostridia bacterium]|nr:hypothetical protein [Clostridia bacterium]
MITEELLTALRDRLKSEISYAVYLRGGQEYTATVTTARVLEDGRVTASFLLSTPGDKREPITEIKVYNKAGQLLAREKTNIVNNVGIIGISYRLFFTIQSEGGVNDA